MFLNCCSARSSKPQSSLSRTWSRTTRLSQSFQVRRDIDAVTKDVVFFNDHVAKVDADPKIDPLLRRDSGIALSHSALHLDSAADCIHDTAEFRQEAIAGVLYNPASMLAI